jgi:Tn3 transposase DDE domain
MYRLVDAPELGEGPPLGRAKSACRGIGDPTDEMKRRATFIQLNRGEARHSMARVVFHDKRGELRQRYREGREDTAGSPGAGRQYDRVVEHDLYAGRA